jgi:hypothetical protein
MGSINKAQFKPSLAKAAACLRMAHRYDEGIRVMNTAIADKSSPNGLLMFTTRAHCYEGAGKWSDAANDFTSTMQVAKTRGRSPLEDAALANAHMERAKCYDHMGKSDLAAKDKAISEQTSRSLESDLLGK